MKRSWRDQYRRCEKCNGEYRPKRQGQSYCTPGCRRAAAYGRERFAAGIKGKRRRRLEASDKWPTEASERSFRKRTFSSIKPLACKGVDAPVLVQERQWSYLYRIYWPDGVISTPANLTRCKDAIRNT
jgi:hypothetical protein